MPELSWLHPLPFAPHPHSMSFAHIVGHERCIEVLRRAIASERIPQAYLFCGPNNVGKTLSALTFAKAVNCAELHDGSESPDACDECASCAKVAAGTHPDVTVVGPVARLGSSDEADGGDIHVEGTMIRTEQVGRLIASAHLTPVEGRRKVFILQHAEAMNEASANRLLKTLEEPPGATTFVLTTHSPSQLLPTIQSRCQWLRFGPVPEAAAVERLQTDLPELPGDVIGAAVSLSEGRFGWARTVLSHPPLLQIREAVLQTASSLPSLELIEALPCAERLIEAAEQWWLAVAGEELGAEALRRQRDRVLRAQVGELLSVLRSWFRDVALACARPDADEFVNADWAEQLRVAAKRCDPMDAHTACKTIGETRRFIQAGNANLRLALEVMFIKLIRSGR
ncbi:MAG: DNA polymerase III subunit delta' [Armatimonadota bacterium]